MGRYAIRPFFRCGPWECEEFKVGSMKERAQDRFNFFKINIWWHMATLFDLLFSQADIDTSTFFTYSNFAWELHGGVDVMRCGGLFVLGLH
jgi:hypothetical protein